MKLQTAIDRTTLEKAEQLIHMLSGNTDTIEIGTSLVKDYGLFNLKYLNDIKGETLLLADVKTCDEGEYEFYQGYAQGFDILTVMGSSATETLEKCYQVSLDYGKTMLIDLLECSDEKISEIANFKHAIYCLHTSVDKGGSLNPAAEIRRFRNKFPQIERISIAGGITLNSIKQIKKEKVECAIVGSAITKAKDPEAALKQFNEEIKNEID